MLSSIYNVLSAISYGPGGHKIATIASGVIMCILAAVSIALIVVVLLQKSNQDDVSAITGGSSETYYKKNKELTAELAFKTGQSGKKQFRSQSGSRKEIENCDNRLFFYHGSCGNRIFHYRSCKLMRKSDFRIIN